MPATHSPETDGWMSTSMAARAIGVSGESVRAWLRSGALPHTVTPLGALIRREDVEALIERRERAAVTIP